MRQKHNKPSVGLDGKLLPKAPGKERPTSSNHFLLGKKIFSEEKHLLHQPEI